MNTVELSITIPTDLLDKLNEIASIHKSDLQQQIVAYMNAGVQNDIPIVKHEHLIKHAKEVLEQHGVPTTDIDTIVGKLNFQ